MQTALVSEPKVVALPVSPKLKLVILACLVIGIGAGLVTVYLVDTLDDRFRTPEELVEQLGLPVLSSIPRIEGIEDGGLAGIDSVVTLARPNSIESEAFRALRTGINFSGGDTKRLAITSSEPSDGKTTVSTNLAAAFAYLGLKAGLLDLDVYGPSAPTLLGVGARKPRMREDKVLEPLEAQGLKTMSVGYLVDPSQPMVWRGAMATSAVRQMLDDVAWGDLDVLVLDLPPGTGDVQLTLVQRVPLSGAIIVSTPQEMALADVRRGLAMFEKTQAPVLGIVENMAYFETPDGKRTHIFGEGGARRTAAQAGVPFLGEIPIDVSLREACDAGAPLVSTKPNHPIAQRFRAIAEAARANVAQAGKPAPRIVVS